MNLLLSAREFAERLRVEGCEWADEIIDALDFVDTAEYLELCEDIEFYVPKGMLGKPRKGVEWLGDRSHLVDELRDICTAEGFNPKTDIADVLKASLFELAALRNLFEAHGLPGNGDLYEFAHDLCNRDLAEYDL